MDLVGIGALDGQEAGPGGNIVQFGAPGIVAGYPVKVLFHIGGIDDQHIGLVCFEAIDDQVVHNAAGLVGEGAVLGSGILLVLHVG